MDLVEVRELRYFVAVAEELNFGRAAQRLGIAQPPLSKAIQQLEQKLGVTLLDRTTRRVELTTAGAALLEDARPAIEAVAGAARRAQRAGQSPPRLLLAVKAGGDGELLEALLARYRELADGLPEVEITVAGWGEPEAMLRNGQADAALLHSPFDRRGIDLEPLRSDPRVAALPKAHKLARRRRLRRADLTGELFPQWTGATPNAACYWEGRDPDSLRMAWPEQPGTDSQTPGPVVGDLAQLLAIVALGQAVALLPAAVADRNPRAGVIYRPVTDVSPSVTAIAWPETSHSPAVAALLQAATDLSTDEQRSPALLA